MDQGQRNILTLKERKPVILQEYFLPFLAGWGWYWAKSCRPGRGLKEFMIIMKFTMSTISVFVHFS